MVRILEATSSDFKAMNHQDILDAIAQSEGRVMVSEITSNLPSVYKPSNCEIACAFGADILLLNMFDVDHPLIDGIGEGKDVIQTLKKYTGRLIGINLEPTDFNANTEWKISKGRQATVENAIKAKQLGIDILTITGNPSNHVSNSAIVSAIQEIRKAVDDIVIISGKMHASGISSESANKILDEMTILDFIKAGSDIILLPCPATVPGIDLETARKWVNLIHLNNKLAMTSIGTSQEGADENTIRQLALLAKQTGTDIHHIGDAGYQGIAIPENILAYSIAIKGKRHTYRRMATSINR